MAARGPLLRCGHGDCFSWATRMRQLRWNASGAPETCVFMYAFEFDTGGFAPSLTRGLPGCVRAGGLPRLAERLPECHAGVDLFADQAMVPRSVLSVAVLGSFLSACARVPPPPTLPPTVCVSTSPAPAATDTITVSGVRVAFRTPVPSEEAYTGEHGIWRVSERSMFLVGDTVLVWWGPCAPTLSDCVHHYPLVSCAGDAEEGEVELGWYEGGLIGRGYYARRDLVVGGVVVRAYGIVAARAKVPDVMSLVREVRVIDGL